MKWIDEAFIQILNINLRAGILIFMILLLRKAFFKRLSKKLFKGLWIVALIRLICPFFISLPVFSEVQQKSGGISQISEKMVKELHVLSSGYNIDSIIKLNTEVCLYQILFIFLSIIGFTGMIMCSVHYMTRYQKERSILKESLPLSSKQAAFLQEVMKNKCKLHVRVSDRIQGPVVFGIINPCIIIPRDFMKDMMEKKDALWMKNILLHERQHIMAFDNLWRILCVMCVCIHWYNPLVWCMKYYFYRDLELACDEAVLIHLDKPGKRKYAEALLSMAYYQSGESFMLNSGFGGSQLKERMEAIMRFQKKKLTALCCAGVIFVASISVFADTVSDLKNVSYHEISEIVEMCEEIIATYPDFPDYTVYPEKTWSNEPRENALLIRCFDLNKFLEQEGNGERLMKMAEEILAARADFEEIHFSYYGLQEESKGRYEGKTTSLKGIMFDRKSD